MRHDRQILVFIQENIISRADLLSQKTNVPICSCCSCCCCLLPLFQGDFIANVHKVYKNYCKMHTFFTTDDLISLFCPFLIFVGTFQCFFFGLISSLLQLHQKQTSRSFLASLFILTRFKCVVTLTGVCIFNAISNICFVRATVRAATETAIGKTTKERLTLGEGQLYDTLHQDDQD